MSDVDGSAGMLHASAVRSRARSLTPANDFRCDATYCLTATARIKTESAIQSTAQNIAGFPVAFAIFSASVGTVVAKGEDRKNTVFRSSRAFRTHCTASRLTRKVATFADAKRATANKPTDRSPPANKVKGRPPSDPHVPLIRGLITPKIVVSARTTIDEPNNTTRAATDRRISTSSVAPKVMAPT